MVGAVGVIGIELLSGTRLHGDSQHHATLADGHRFVLAMPSLDNWGVYVCAEDALPVAVGALLLGDTTVLPLVAEHLRNDPDGRCAAALECLGDELKIQILQQFFQHGAAGSHKTSFDLPTVSALLRKWYGIELSPCVNHAPEEANQLDWASSQIYLLEFGETLVFWYSSDLKTSSAKRLVEVVANRAVLTTEVASPPCELAEFVPLWLQNREHEPYAYYLAGKGGGHPIQHYFDQQLAAVQSALGISITHCSTEMALIANGDALRFHRDRLVRQYEKLNERSDAADGLQVVQDLTLIDWDMQSNTMSGTAFDHSDGDRYLFLLRPSEVVALFFAEQPIRPGPMMMPYHCALPVLDFRAGATVGPAKGKRLSALTRGLASEHEVSRLINRATKLSLDAVEAVSDEGRIYRSGVRVITYHTLPETTLSPANLMLGAAEGVSVVQLSVEANASLMRIVIGDVRLDGYHLFRIEKHGEGFSDLAQTLPRMIVDASEVIIVNRSLYGPQREVSFPLAIDYTQQRKPWIQLLRLRTGNVVRFPSSVVPMLRLTPTDHLLHRSAAIDSFYPLPTEQPRLVNIVDVAFR